MDQALRELYVSRIVSGESRCSINGEIFYIRHADRRQRYRSNTIYKEVFDDARFHGLLHDDELLSILCKQNLWHSRDQEQYDKLIKAIDDFKVGLFEQRLAPDHQAKIRVQLQRGKAELLRLEGIRHSLDHISCAGVASQARFRYLMGAGIQRASGEPLWKTEEDWNTNDALLDKLYDQILTLRPSETEYRVLARTEPWKSIWAARKFCGRGVFDIASVDLADDQRSLLIWSSVYESIYEHPECPPEAVLDDDDTLDGWMILQRRKREVDQARSRESSIKSDKIRNADEIMFVAKSVEEAREINRMNSDHANIIKQQRLDAIKQQGEVSEMQMPDTWNRFMMARAAAESQNMRGK